MKPFLILQLREMDGPADGEFHDFLKYGKLKKSEVKRIRMDREGFSGLNPSDYSAIIVGGGPSNVSDKETDKSDHQKRYERELNAIYPQIIRDDIPFLGSCYGFGSIAAFAGAKISKEKYSEEVGYVKIDLESASQNDELLSGLPKTFTAFCGHKEACQNMPQGAVLLAGSKTCPIQMIRFGENVYATQFHCELDAEGIADRIRHYKNHGYFEPESADRLIAKTKDIKTEVPQLIWKRFVEKYKRD